MQPYAQPPFQQPLASTPPILQTVLPQAPFGHQSSPYHTSDSGTYPTLGAPRLRALVPTPIKSEWEEMKNYLKDLKDGIDIKTFKFENDFPYPFDKTITMTPFPKHFEIPKFDKFRGKSDPVNTC